MEERLFGGLKYTIEDLVGIPGMFRAFYEQREMLAEPGASLIPFGGLSEIAVLVEALSPLHLRWEQRSLRAAAMRQL